MAAPKVPSLRRHKKLNLGVVRLNGNDVYLGSWPAHLPNPPPDVQSRYDTAIAEWLARGRQPAIKSQRSTRANSEQPASDSCKIRITAILTRFLAHASSYYRRSDGTITHEVDEFALTLRPLNHLYGNLAAESFGPLQLKSVRELMMQGYHHPTYGQQPALCRNVINKRMRRIVLAFKWAASEDLVPGSLWQNLKSVSGLKLGRSGARESEPVAPVAADVVDRTIQHLTPHVAGMVRLQMLTGARPGEAASITLAQIDRSGSIWLYRPSQHKTQHHGKSRVIAIGPRAQSLLFEFIRIECPICGDRNRPPRLDSRDGVTCGLCTDRLVGVWNRNEVHGLDEPIFSPKAALAEVYADRRATRKSRVPPSQKCRKKASPRKTRKDAYDITSYDRAIAAACKRAGVEHWHPNQLRHTHATEIRRKYGLEAAQVALGHSQANVTQVYAERDLTLATRIAAEIG